MTENADSLKPSSDESTEITPLSFEELISDGKRQLDIASSSINEINSFKEKLITGSQDEPSISSLIDQTKDKVLKAYGLINTYESEILLYRDKLFTGIDSDEAIVTKIDDLIKRLEETKEKSSASLNEISSLLAQSKEKSEAALKRLTVLGNQITTFHSKLLLGSETEPSVNAIIDKFQKDADEKTKSMGIKERDLSAFHERVFGKKTEDGKQLIGYQQEFEAKIKMFDTAHRSETSRFDELFKKIEGLLPGATSAGLAHAYDKQKNSYGSQIILWQWSFIITMGLMIVIGVWAFYETINVTMTLNESLVSLIRKLPFFVPLIWLGVFSGKRLSQNKRLQQEYAFKETLAKSFDGHKTQVEALKLANDGLQKELMAKLLKNLIESTGENPSSTLDNKAHDEKPPFSGFFGKQWGNDKKSQPKRDESKNDELSEDANK